VDAADPDPRLVAPVLRAAVAALVAGAALIVALPAPARDRPPMSSADRQAIGVLIEAFVKDVVLRQNLAAGWELTGPDLRGGTTRAAWIKGTGVTVERFPVADKDLRHVWSGHLVAPGHGELSVVMHPKPGSGYEETAATVDVRKLHGRWVVDLFYSAAVFHKVGISGPNDFTARASGGTSYSRSRIRGLWLFAGIAVGVAAVLAVPSGLWLAHRRRERRALAEYHEAHS